MSKISGTQSVQRSEGGGRGERRGGEEEGKGRESSLHGWKCVRKSSNIARKTEKKIQIRIILRKAVCR